MTFYKRTPKEDEEIFMVGEDMPLFPGCDTEKTKEDKKKCSDRKVFEFVFKNLKYPVIARENGIEGTAVVQFVVDRDGTVKDVSVLKEIGGGCGEEEERGGSCCQKERGGGSGQENR